MLGLINHNINFFLLKVFKQIKICLYLGKKIIGTSRFLSFEDTKHAILIQNTACTTGVPALCLYLFYVEIAESILVLLNVFC